MLRIFKSLPTHVAVRLEHQEYLTEHLRPLQNKLSHWHLADVRIKEIRKVVERNPFGYLLVLPSS
jgi:hypothetical protein